MTRKFVKILDYQFGIGSGNKINVNGLNTIFIKNKNEIDFKDLITQEKLGTFKASTGQIELTITGLRRLIQSPSTFNLNYLVFDGDEIQGNTLFRKGILEYSKDLIPKSQVVIFNKERKNIIGSGELVVGSNFLKNSEAVLWCISAEVRE